MKSLPVHRYGLLLLCIVSVQHLKAQPIRTKEPVLGFGYILKGDSVEFVFGEQSMITIGTVEVNLEKRIAEVSRVNVAGDFNDWNPNLPKFQMTKVGRNLFKLSIPKTSLGKKGELKQFKFVLNGKYWVEPPPQALNKFTGRDKNCNLTLAF